MKNLKVIIGLLIIFITLDLLVGSLLYFGTGVGPWWSSILFAGALLIGTIIVAIIIGGVIVLVFNWIDP